ncbi:hypothetical protein V8G54_035652 [Vigna mungo]|uniref:C3H1-type domain-containing protein n=1 Tax=Vigna mungo TaxID=3915 RepID=A0AAQ3RBB5_VIGMU
MEIERKICLRSSPTTCEDWMNGNCPKGEKCPNLHWWVNTNNNFHNDKAAAGGIMRDSHGEFLFAFSSVLRVDLEAEAELFAIKLGMEIGISMGYKNLIVESDSLTAIQLINGRVIHQRHPFYALVSSIIQMSVNADYITWNQVFRETNSVADAYTWDGKKAAAGGVMRNSHGEELIEQQKLNYLQSLEWK